MKTCMGTFSNGTVAMLLMGALICDYTYVNTTFMLLKMGKLNF